MRWKMVYTILAIGIFLCNHNPLVSAAEGRAKVGHPMKKANKALDYDQRTTHRYVIMGFDRISW